MRNKIMRALKALVYLAISIVIGLVVCTAMVTLILLGSWWVPIAIGLLIGWHLVYNMIGKIDED